MTDQEADAPDEAADPDETQDDAEEHFDTPIDDTDDEQPVEAPVEAPAPPPTDMALERAARDGEKQWTQAQKRLKTIWGAEAENFVPCPLCLDQHKGFIDVRHSGQLPEELAQVILQFIRGAQQVEYLNDPQHSTCPACGGHGKVVSGSKVPGKELLTCPACAGYGFVPPPGKGAPQNGAVEVFVPAVDAPVSDMPQPEQDAWGSPHYLPDGSENPNYGKMPSYRNPAFP